MKDRNDRLQRIFSDFCRRLNLRYHNAHRIVDSNYEMLGDLPVGPEMERLRPHDHQVAVDGSLLSLILYLKTLTGFRNFVKLNGATEAERLIDLFAGDVKKCLNLDEGVEMKDIPIISTFSWFGRIAVKSTEEVIRPKYRS